MVQTDLKRNSGYSESFVYVCVTLSAQKTVSM